MKKKLYRISCQGDCNCDPHYLISCETESLGEILIKGTIGEPGESTPSVITGLCSTMKHWSEPVKDNVYPICEDAPIDQTDCDDMLIEIVPLSEVWRRVHGSRQRESATLLNGGDRDLARLTESSRDLAAAIEHFGPRITIKFRPIGADFWIDQGGRGGCLEWAQVIQAWCDECHGIPARQMQLSELPGADPMPIPEATTACSDCGAGMHLSEFVKHSCPGKSARAKAWAMAGINIHPSTPATEGLSPGFCSASDIGGFEDEPCNTEVGSPREDLTSADLISEACGEIHEMLLSKNAQYGDSALDPIGVFSSADPIALIDARMDDKLSRIKRGDGTGNEDAEMDLLGYLILKRAALKKLGVRSHDGRSCEYCSSAVEVGSDVCDACVEERIKESQTKGDSDLQEVNRLTLEMIGHLPIERQEAFRIRLRSIISRSA